MLGHLAKGYVELFLSVTPDSSEEKLYSKYTDVVIHEAYSCMGFNSLVLKERADVADVECVTDDYSFVADAKAFTAKPNCKKPKGLQGSSHGWLETRKAICNGCLPSISVTFT